MPATATMKTRLKTLRESRSRGRNLLLNEGLSKPEPKGSRGSSFLLTEACEVERLLMLTVDRSLRQRDESIADAKSGVTSVGSEERGQETRTFERRRAREKGGGGGGGGGGTRDKELGEESKPQRDLKGVEEVEEGERVRETRGEGGEMGRCAAKDWQVLVRDREGETRRRRVSTAAPGMAQKAVRAGSTGKSADWLQWQWRYTGLVAARGGPAKDSAKRAH